MLCVPTAADTGVTVTEHVALSVLDAASVHVPVIVSPASDVTATTVPTPGFDFVPLAPVSVTVTVALLPWPTTTELGLSATVVEVVRFVTVKVCPGLLLLP